MVVGFYYKVVILIAIYGYVGNLYIAMLVGGKSTIHRIYLQGVAQVDRIENCLQIVVTIGSAPNNIETEVYFSYWKCYHTINGWGTNAMLAHTLAKVRIKIYFRAFFLQYSLRINLFSITLPSVMADTKSGPTRRKKVIEADGTAKLQPQALEIERTVLGALMIDKDAYAVVCEMLHPDSFYEKRNQYIYDAIRELSMREKPVDMLTVAEELSRMGRLEEVGGPAYIADLCTRVASSANISYHSRIIAQKSLARQLISFAGEVGTKAYDETLDIESVMQEAEGALFELSQRNMKKDYTQVDPVIDEAIKTIQKAAASKDGITGIPTGFTRLDDITSGWQASDLIIIAGRPAMGKTAFALSMAKNIAAEYRKPTALFSLEMSNVQLVNRLISNCCEIEGKKILSGQLRPDEWDRLDKNINKLLGAPLYLDDTPGLSVFELRTKARRLVREHGVQIIMIDYLQLMNANGMRFNSRQEEVSTISRSLKSLAKELEIPILALSQLNRDVEGREGIEGKRPQLSDLRESGAIEQDADMVAFVHRPEYYHLYSDGNGRDMHGMAQIIIAKHRKGATGDVILRFRGELTRFENPDDGTFRPSGRGKKDSGGEIVGSKLNAGAKETPSEAAMGLSGNFDTIDEAPY